MPLHRSLLYLAFFALGLAVSSCGHSAHVTNPKAVRFETEGANAYEKGELDRAAGLFSLALEYEPRMAEARMGLGLVAFSRQDLATAEAHFKTALSLNGELAEAHLNLGTICLEREDFDCALKRYRQSLAIDPGYVPARLGAGNTLLLLGRPEEARWDIQKATEIAPNNAGAQASLAIVLAELGHIANAELAAQKALQLNPKLPDAHRARGEILQRRGDFAGAAEEFRLAVQGGPLNVGDRVSLVRNLMLSKQLDAADAEIRSLEGLAPTRPEVPFLQGFLALARDDSATALVYATRALKLKPRYPQARLILGEALLQQGRVAEGKEQLRRFIDEAPPSMAAERKHAQEFLSGQ